MSCIPDKYAKWKAKDYKEELRRILILNGYQETVIKKRNALVKQGKDVKKTFTFGSRSFTVLMEESDGEWSLITHPYDYGHCVGNPMMVWYGVDRFQQ